MFVIDLQKVYHSPWVTYVNTSLQRLGLLNTW